MYRPVTARFHGATTGLWLSAPVFVTVVLVWSLGLTKTGFYALILAGGLSLPWGALGGLIAWTILSAAGEAIAFDTFGALYACFSAVAILGAHLNGYLLFAGNTHSATPPRTSG